MSKIANYDLMVDFDYVYNGKQYLSNLIYYDFGYGTISGEINSIFQSYPSTTTNSISGIKTQVILPNALVITNEQRLIIEYRHLFDYKKYYNGTLQSNDLSLKTEYKNLLIHSNTFNHNGNTIPYEVRVNYLLTESPRNNSVIQVFSAGGSCIEPYSNKYCTANYGSGQTYNFPYNKTASNMNIMSIISGGLRRQWTLTVPPISPAMPNLTSIDISFNKWNKTEKNLKLNFLTPWNKPADMEIKLDLQWDEMFDQSE